MPLPKLEFFFDCSSPWTYLAFHGIEKLAAEAGADLVWRPILVGGVFNSVNQGVYEQRANPLPVKLRYYAKDLRDWASSAGIRIGSPPVSAIENSPSSGTENTMTPLELQEPPSLTPVNW